MRTEPRPVEAPAEATRRLQRSRAVFECAADQPPASWHEIVTRESNGDDALRDEVLRLLSADRSESFHLDLSSLSLGDSSEGEERIGDVVAQYRLTRVIGSGGMGTVYEGVREDGLFDQRVAVKLIRSQLGVSGMATRFRRERQILAALEHRNIARLLDGGATSRGEPYFIMEYVDGEHITDYCNARRLSIRDRMRLFVQVCAAVHHAHGKLIVHRDLKPANMLVADDGSVKLLDFGVAKLLGAQDGAAAPTTHTVPRQLTPEYASPEQLRDEPASVASDVYSLGVVLYELAAGRRPFDTPSRSPFALLQAVENGAPLPSVVATINAAEHAGESSVARLRHRLSGEVDNIVGKALRADPGRRYESAEQLAEDIRRFLDGRAVLAQPDSVGYRTRKFISRHWISVAAAVVAVVALVGGTVVTATQAHRLGIERAKTARVNGFLRQVLSSADTRWVKTTRARVTLSEVLDDAAARAGVDLAAEPAVEVAVRKVLGQTFASMSRYAPAKDQAIRALQLDMQLGASPVPDIAEDFRDLGLAQLGSGDSRAADTLFAAALRLCETHSQRADTAHVCAHSLNDLGLARLAQHNFASAESLLQQTLTIARQVVGPVHPAVALVLGELGDVRATMGDLAGAERWYRESLRMYTALEPRDFSERASSLGGLALVLEATGRVTMAESLLVVESRMVDNLEGPTHPDAGLNWVHLGGVHRQMGDLKRAQSETDRGLAILEGRMPPSDRYYTKVQAYRALMLLASGRAAQADSLLEAVVVPARQRYGPTDLRVAELEAALGKTLLALRKPRDAERVLSNSYAAYSQHVGVTHPWTLATGRDLAIARGGAKSGR
ncbi:MAG: serine/threonine-protein kinase [bacterium]